jgi:hypothetical protein
MTMPDPTALSKAFVRLKPSDAPAGAQVGCLFLLAAVLLLPGIGILAAFIINPAGKGDMWVMPVVGGVLPSSAPVSGNWPAAARK